MLADWRQEELARIDSTLSGAERKAALCQLLDQETQLLASIGRHKLDADTENRQRFIKQFLEQVSYNKRLMPMFYFVVLISSWVLFRCWYIEVLELNRLLSILV